MPIEARHEFQTLDAMRGVAAVCVMLYHFSDKLPDLGTATAMRSANLAVDLFFVLSGFVIAFAYDTRLASGMTLRRFVTLRLIRLLPMIAVGASLGGALLLASGGHPARDVLLATAANALGLPVPAWSMFPTNDAEWSLFCEIVANVAFAVAFPLLDRRVLRGVVLVCGVALVPVTIVHGSVHHAAGPGFLLSDLLRVGYSFFLGVLLWRTRSAWRPMMPSMRCEAVLALTTLFFLVPFSGTARTVYDLLALGIGSPLLVMLGSAAVPAIGGARFATVSARLSYPLYAIHLPVLHWVELLCGRYGWSVWSTNALTVAVLIPVSYGLAQWYDAPMRTLLALRGRVTSRVPEPQPG